jgi:hypothetical protein
VIIAESADGTTYPICSKFAICSFFGDGTALF